MRSEGRHGPCPPGDSDPHSGVLGLREEAQPCPKGLVLGSMALPSVDWTFIVYVPPLGLWVPEGQRAEITTAALDASNLLASVLSPQRPEHDVLFQITQFPTRGQL